MPWALLLDLRVLLGIALAAALGYGYVQHVRVQQCQAEFAQFRADVDRLASEAKVKNAQQAAQEALHAQEVLSDLQTRNAALSAAYERLRANAARSRAVPALSSAAPSLSACSGDAGQPDPNIGRLDALEAGILEITAKADRELAKYAELWRLQQKNAASP